MNTAQTVLALCGPASPICIWAMHRISRNKHAKPTRDVYIPPPITDQHVADEWAVITWNYYRQEQQ